MIDELRLKCDELGIKYDKRHKENALKTKIAEYEKNNGGVKEDEGEQVEADASKEDVKDVLLPARIENDVVFALLNEDRLGIKVYKKVGGVFIREYSLDMHGENWFLLCESFIRATQFKKKK